MARGDEGGQTLLGALIAPACAGGAAAIGMLGERIVRGRLDISGMPIEEIGERLLDLWLRSLLFAYPAFIGFFLLAAVLIGLGLRGRGVFAFCGAGAGGGGMAVYLYRTYGTDFFYELVGEPVTQASAMQMAGGFVLPVIGVVSGIIGGLVFAPFANARR